MPPYSSSTLKRKYSGKYQSAGKYRKSNKTYPTYATVATAPAPTRVELKYDYGEFTQLMKAVGSVTLLTTIPNGSGSSERIGKRIQYHDIELGWHLRPNSLFNGNKTQWMLVYDKQTNGTLPSYLDMFQSTAVEAFQDSDTRGRFQVLYRSECLATNNTNGYSDHQGSLTGRTVISLKGKKCEYTGTGATISDIEKGALYVVTQSYTDDAVALEFVNRIQYSDA